MYILLLIFFWVNGDYYFPQSIVLLAYQTKFLLNETITNSFIKIATLCIPKISSLSVLEIIGREGAVINNLTMKCIFYYECLCVLLSNGCGQISDLFVRQASNFSSSNSLFILALSVAACYTLDSYAHIFVTGLCHK